MTVVHVTKIKMFTQEIGRLLWKLFLRFLFAKKKFIQTSRYASLYKIEWGTFDISKEEENTEI